MTMFSLLLCAVLLEASTSFTNPITVGANPHYLKPIIKKTHEQRTPSGLFYSSERGPPYTNIVSAPAQKIIDKHNHVIYRPAIDQGEVDHTSKQQNIGQQTAFVLLPGCFLEPEQYGALALAIQNQSTHPAWIVVPKLFANMANPLTLPQAVTEAMDSLHSLGYPSENKVFVGGHSLGGIFIPHLLEQLDQDTRQSIAGTIQLGSFVMRQHREGKDLFFRAQDMLYKTIPRLTLAGDVDGLIRSSRIAEDIRHHVLDPINAGRDADQTRLNHTVILVPGMNHFQMVNTSIAHFLEKSRDLEPEISKEEAISSTAFAICEFMEVHQIKDNKHDQRKASLLEKIKNTEDYLGPLIDAMELEGNHHLDKPCYLATDEDSASCLVGSPFVEGIQQHVTPKEVVNDIYIGDRSCTSWYFNPFADPPFYHPSVTTSSNTRYKVKLNTYSEAIYERLDSLFDGGFFSNTALEVRFDTRPRGEKFDTNK